MIDIVHLSDTHFGTETPAVVESLKRELHANPPDTVLLTGDITQRARVSQFKAAARFMQALPVARWFAIPGNHDIPLYNLYARFVSPYGHYTRSFPAREYHVRAPGVYMVGFDATRPYRHTRGQLDEAHVRAVLARAQREMREGDMLLVSVHQPLAVALDRDRENIVINAQTLAALFAEYKVDIVLSGHVHYPLLSTAGRYYPGLSRDFVLSGAGTAVSHRIRPGAPNSFNRLRFADGALTLSRYDYDDGTDRFTLHTTQRFTLGADGWVPSDN